MSSSTGRKSGKADATRSRRKNQEDSDGDRRDRDITPRGYGHQPDTYANLETLEEGVERFSLADDGNESEAGGDHGNSPPRLDSRYATKPSSPSSWGEWQWATSEPRGYWWRSKRNEWNELVYDYNTESNSPGTEIGVSSSSDYTIARTKDGIQSQSSWQPSYTVDPGPTQGEGEFTRSNYRGAVALSRVSYGPNQPSTKLSQTTVCQDVYIGRTIWPNVEESSDKSVSGRSGSYYESTNDYYQQMSRQVSGSDAKTRSSELPPIFVPAPVICNCDSREHLCGVIIFPSQPSPSDGKICSKKGKGKVGSSSSSSSQGSGSGSRKLSVKGPNGSGCGPIVMPGITPSPKPQPPANSASREEWEAYEEQIEEWEESYEDWKHITCPCRHGYFDEDGRWVSGADVRREMMPPNPRWASSNGIAPDVRSNRDRYKARLFERSNRYQNMDL